MAQSLNLKTQLIIIGSLLMFFYVFFAFATSIYRDYKLESHIQTFEQDIEKLETLVYKKPSEIQYFESFQFKDKYAKENLNLINPGEKLIIIPQDDQIVRSEIASDRYYSNDILQKPVQEQWWEYFFGQTLTL